MAKGEDTGNHPGRKVHKEVFDHSIADVSGVPTQRKYVSRYDEAGSFISQGYTDHGPATPQQINAGTWADSADIAERATRLWESMPAHKR